MESGDWMSDDEFTAQCPPLAANSPLRNGSCPSPARQNSLVQLLVFWHDVVYVESLRLCKRNFLSFDSAVSSN